MGSTTFGGASKQLLDGTYQSTPLRRKSIDKPGGGQRELGIPNVLDRLMQQAIRHGKSRKGPWRMAKTIASGVGMTNAWLQAQGQLSLKSQSATLAPLRRTA